MHPKFYPSLHNLIKTSPYLNDEDLKQFGATQKKNEPIPGDVLNSCYQQIMQYEADYKSKPNQYKQKQFTLDEMVNTPKHILNRHAKDPFYIPIIQSVNDAAAAKLADENSKLRIRKEIRRAKQLNSRDKLQDSLTAGAESFPESVSHPYEAFSKREISSPHNKSDNLDWGSLDRSDFDPNSNIAEGSLVSSEEMKTTDGGTLTDAANNDNDNTTAPAEPSTEIPKISDYTAADVVTCLVNMLSIQFERDHSDSHRFAETQQSNQLTALENAKYGQNNKLLLQNHLSSVHSGSRLLSRPSSASIVSLKHPALHTLNLPKTRPTSAGIFGGIARGSNPVKPLTMTTLRPKSASALTNEIERIKNNTTVESAGLFQISTKVTKIRKLVVGHQPAEYWPAPQSLD